MSPKLRAPLVLLAIAVFTGCNGPLPFLSGSALNGGVVPTPQTWALEEDFGMAQLETNPDEPYSVNIAYTQIDGQLYLNAGDTETQWVKYMDANPNVRLRISDAIYELRAERIRDPQEVAAFGKAWTDHSMFHRDPVALEQVWIYRLAGR